MLNEYMALLSSYKFLLLRFSNLPVKSLYAFLSRRFTLTSGCAAR